MRLACRRVWAVVALAVVLSIALARMFSRRFLFPTHEVELVEVPADVRRISTVAGDGVRVQALELPGRSGAPVVVHFHNNRETAAHNVELGRELVKRGLGVVLVEFRGYGSAAGAQPSEEGLYLDAEAVLDWLERRGVRADRILLWGHSLGSGVAAEMASRGRGRALVLVAPYTSIPDLVTAAVPLAPARLLLPDGFDTLEKAASIRIRTLVIHGERDEIVPFWMGEELARAIADARMLRVRDGRHGDLFARDRERLLDEVSALARSL
jgi:hypothetical protein